MTVRITYHVQVAKGENDAESFTVGRTFTTRRAAERFAANVASFGRQATVFTRWH